MKVNSKGRTVYTVAGLVPVLSLGLCLAHSSAAGASIPFKPVPRVDEQGKPVKATQMLRLPNGRTVRADQYFQQLDALERKANVIGESIYDRPDARPSDEGPSANFNTAALQEQRALKAKQFAIPTDRAYLKMTDGRSEQLAPWSYDFGNSEIASAHVRGYVKFSATKTEAQLDGALNLYAYVLNDKKRILDATVTMLAPEKAKATTHLTVAVGGYDVYDKTFTGQVHDFGVAKIENILLDKSTTWTGHFLGVPIEAKVGVQGVAGIEPGLTLETLGVGVNLKPYCAIKGYAEAGIDLGIVSGGVGGDIEILGYHGNLAGTAEVRVSKGRLARKFALDYTNSIKAGEGRLYIYGKIWPFGKKKKTIIDWNGVTLLDQKLYGQEWWAFL